MLYNVSYSADVRIFLRVQLVRVVLTWRFSAFARSHVIQRLDLAWRPDFPMKFIRSWMEGKSCCTPRRASVAKSQKTFYFFCNFNLILRIKTNKHANSCKFITIMKTKFFKMNIPYKEVKNVVTVQTMYVVIFALGFLFQRSLIVGTNQRKVTTPQIL